MNNSRKPKHAESINNRFEIDEEAKLNTELEDYSISERHVVGTCNVFFDNLKALLKKKFFVQYRDKRTIVIEQLFPIFFIFVGFALGTIKIFRDGEPRILTP